MVTVVVPTKGIALPLVSAGGTGWVLTAAAIGAVAGMARAAEREGMKDE
ncbi:MAG: FtsW/RodA/SpoVE family cell cycle protein [Opitutales bacterium]